MPLSPRPIIFFYNKRPILATFKKSYKPCQNRNTISLYLMHNITEFQKTLFMTSHEALWSIDTQEIQGRSWDGFRWGRLPAYYENAKYLTAKTQKFFKLYQSSRFLSRLCKLKKKTCHNKLNRLTLYPNGWEISRGTVFGETVTDDEDDNNGCGMK